MKALRDPVEILQKELAAWGTPFVELDCFGTDSAKQIAHIMDQFCRSCLGSGIRGYLFYGASVGSTYGVKLEDGRGVVIKVRPPIETNPNLSLNAMSLNAICAVMSWLADRNFPCPKVLLGPTQLARGLATVEELIDRGEHGDGFKPEYRKVMAQGLADLIERLRSFKGDVSCLQHFQRGDALYPQPHSKLFDFQKTAAGAEWIDDFARRARRALPEEGPPVLGHADWRVEHLRFDDGKIVAIYDWDSLVFRPEAQLVGVLAHAFTADWTLEGVRRIPKAEDMHAYVADYETARGRPFSKAERQSLFATCVYSITYGARCTHSLEPAKTEWEKDSWPYLLKSEGEALLREAVE